MNRSSSFPRVQIPEGALLGDGFVAEALLEEWLRTGVASRNGALLLMSDGKRYLVTEGLRILGRRNGESDPYGLTGRLIGLRALLRRGALIGPDGVRLGAIIYDAQFGVLAELLADDQPMTPARTLPLMSSVPPSPR